jgi:hypothetical protein
MQNEKEVDEARNFPIIPSSSTSYAHGFAR